MSERILRTHTQTKKNESQNKNLNMNLKTQCHNKYTTRQLAIRKLMIYMAALSETRNTSHLSVEKVFL